eukprot:COSAG05_NODE_290_length_12056_cov_14.204232_10_plen_452_part_00
MYPRGREALLVDPIVVQALQQVAKEGWEQEARQHARVALAALSDRQPAAEGRNERSAATATRSGGTAAAVAEHVMLSYNWGHQSVIKRINTSLKSRGYLVWIDIEKMQGSTVEVMSAAVEDAAVMCYGISQAYKESANCRLEAQYAFQQKKEMVPLMLEDGYRANGWLGMLLGVRLWYGFYGTVLSSEEAFEGKMEELCRELGDRGLVQPAEGVPPVQATDELGQAVVAPSPSVADSMSPMPQLGLSTPSPHQPPREAQALEPARAQELASVPAAARALALAPAASTGDRSGTPSMHVASSRLNASEGVGVMEVVALLKEERTELEAKAKAEMDELRRELQRQREQMNQMREELKPLPPPTIPDEDIVALQARLEALHAADLLTEAELDALDDVVLGYVETRASPLRSPNVGDLAMHAAASTLSKLVAVSAAIATDSVFARQARRRFVVSN